MVYISTDCADDLAAQTSDGVRFAKLSQESRPPCPRILKYQHKWFVGSKSGCSCAFRRLCRESLELGFGPKQDWYPEGEQEIDATKRLYNILKDIVQRGFQVELLNCWYGEEDSDAVKLHVSLSRIPADHFRLFEGYLFIFEQ
jgi:hypothetical protein